MSDQELIALTDDVLASIPTPSFLAALGADRQARWMAYLERLRAMVDSLDPDLLAPFSRRNKPGLIGTILGSAAR